MRISTQKQKRRRVRILFYKRASCLWPAPPVHADSVDTTRGKAGAAVRAARGKPPAGRGRVCACARVDLCSSQRARQLSTCPHDLTSGTRSSSTSFARDSPPLLGAPLPTCTRTSERVLAGAQHFSPENHELSPTPPRNKEDMTRSDSCG